MFRRNTFFVLFIAMYKAQQDEAGETTGDTDAAKDDVVDAEFEEVDGDDKKSA